MVNARWLALRNHKSRKFSLTLTKYNYLLLKLLQKNGKSNNDKNYRPFLQPKSRAIPATEIG
jgi:hypothetical protein